jgi:hypothetical protein
MNIESEIRKVLDEKAYQVDVPSGLGERTLAAAARVDVRQPLFGRYRQWRESRRMKLPAGGYPRWLLAPAAGLAALTLFGVGMFVAPERAPGGDLTTLRATQEPETAGADVDRSRATNVRSETNPAPSNSGDAVAGPVAGVVSSGDVRDTDGANSASGFVGLAPVEGTPQLVRSTDIRIAVGDFEDAWAKANEIATEHGGAVIDSRTKQVRDEIAQGTVQMRVPTDKLEAVLEDLRELGALAQLNTSGDDIAPQMASVEEQISEATVREKELKTLEERATTFSETLDVQERLKKQRKQIKNLEEQLAAYRDRVETSIVTATVFQDEVAAGRGASILGNAVRTSGRLFLTIAAGALVLAGALLPIALLALLVWYVARRMKGRSA